MPWRIRRFILFLTEFSEAFFIFRAGNSSTFSEKQAPMRILVILAFSLLSLLTQKAGAQLADTNTHYIRVHFLYGSRPLQKYKDSEKKWFGGVLGGHVGIESDSGRILNFRGNGNFHVLQNKKNMHSKFDVHDFNGFYALFGSDPDSVKKVVVIIPVTAEQKHKFDSIFANYIKQTPYDYALFGMRCGAAAYEILAQLGITKKFSYEKTYQKIFYPQKLRRRLLTLAEKNKWTIERYEGTNRRKWESH
jgi:hypothetical protein